MPPITLPPLENPAPKEHLPPLDSRAPKSAKYVAAATAKGEAADHESKAAGTDDDDHEFDALAEERRTRLQFCSTEFYFTENVGRGKLPVIRTGALDKRVTVQYRTAGVLEDGLESTANAGDDFVLEEGQLVFGPGEAHKSIGFSVVDDASWEPMEFFRVELVSIEGDADFGRVRVATVNIVDDDVWPGPIDRRDGRETVVEQLLLQYIKERWRHLGWKKGKWAVFAQAFSAFYGVYSSTVMPTYVVYAYTRYNEDMYRKWEATLQAVLLVAGYIALTRLDMKRETKILGWKNLGPTHYSLRMWLVSKVCWFGEGTMAGLSEAEIIETIDRDVGAALDVWNTHFEILKELFVLLLVPFVLFLPLIVSHFTPPEPAAGVAGIPSNQTALVGCPTSVPTPVPTLSPTGAVPDATRTMLVLIGIAFALALLSTGAMLSLIRARSMGHRTHVRNEQQTESRWVQCVANIVADFRLIAGYAGSREREIGRFIAQYKEYWKKLGGRVVFEIDTLNYVEMIFVLGYSALYLIPAVMIWSDSGLGADFLTTFLMLVLVYRQLGSAGQKISTYLHQMEKSIVSIDRIQQLLNIPTEAEAALPQMERDTAHEVARRAAAAAGGPAADFATAITAQELSEKGRRGSVMTDIEFAPKIDRQALKSKAARGYVLPSSRVMPAEEEANEQLREKVRALEEELARIKGTALPPGDERGPTVAATATAAASGEHEDAIVLHRVRFSAKDTAARERSGEVGGISVFTDVMAHERRAKADAAAGSGRWYWAEDAGRILTHDVSTIYQPGNYVAFTSDVSAQLEEAFTAWENAGRDAADPARLCVYTIGERKFRGGWISQLFAHPAASFEVDLEAMTQRNTRTGFKRAIMRRASAESFALRVGGISSTDASRAKASSSAAERVGPLVRPAGISARLPLGVVAEVVLDESDEASDRTGGASGKGTIYEIFSMLAGLRRPQGGGIFVPPHLRVHYVEQLPGIIDDTLLRNLRYGDSADINSPNLSEEEIWRVAELVGLSRMLLGRGDVRCGKNGDAIPFADRVAVAIARALIADPDVLILNRPASSFSEPARLRVQDLLVRFVEHGGVHGMLRHSAELQHIDPHQRDANTSRRDGPAAWAHKRTKAGHGSRTRTVLVHTKNSDMVPRADDADTSSKAHVLLNLSSGTLTTLRPHARA